MDPNADLIQLDQLKQERYQWGFFPPKEDGVHSQAVPIPPPTKATKQMRIIKDFTDGIQQFLMQNFDKTVSVIASDKFTKLCLLHGPDRALRAMFRQDELWTRGDVSDMEDLHFWTEDENMDAAIQVLRYDYLEKVHGVVQLVDITALYDSDDDADQQPRSPTNPDGAGNPDEGNQGDVPDEISKYFQMEGKTTKKFFDDLRRFMKVDKPVPAVAGAAMPTLHPILQGLGYPDHRPTVPQPKGILKPQGPGGVDYSNPQPSTSSASQATPEKMVYEVRFLAPGEWEYTGRIIPISKQKPEPVSPTTYQATKSHNKTEFPPKQPILSHLGQIAGTKVAKTTETAEPAIYKAVDAVARTMEGANIPPDNPYSALTMVMTAAVIEGIKTAKDEKKKAKEDKLKKEGVKFEVLKPTLDDLSVDSFDYNINGTNPESILGPRFKNTVFKNEETRFAVMRGILQRVIDDPVTPRKTKEEALQIMGQCDIPRMFDQMNKRASISVLEAMSRPVAVPETKYPRHDSDSSDEDEDEDQDLISPPTLGSNDNFGPHLVKSLRASLGIGEHDKYDVEKEGKSLKYYLPMLKSQITANRLNRECAFSLFLSVLGGDSEQDVRNRLSSGESFEHVWTHMQKMASERLSQEGAFREIQKICKDKPANPEAAFTKIRNLRLRMYAHIKKPAIRKAQFERTVQEDMIRMMTLHYSMLYPLVMAQFKAKKDAHRMTRKLKKQQGVPKDQIEEFNDIDVLMEIICTNIKKTAGSMDGSGPRPAYVDEVSVTAQPGTSSAQSIGSSRSSQKTGKKQGNSPRIQGQQQQQQQMPVQQQQMYHPQMQQMQPQQQMVQMQQQPQQQMQPMVQTSNATKQLFDAYPERTAGEREQMAKYIQALGENRCILCGRPGHFAKFCKAYAGQRAGDNQCASCDGFHTGGCMKQMLQAKYQEMVANGQVAPRGNGNGRQNRNNGFRKQQNNNQYGQQQNFYPQQQQMMQQQPVQYMTTGQPMMMPQQQVAANYYHVPQPQNVQMMPQGQVMNNNMKVGAVLGNNGTQAVPETAVMNVMTAMPQQVQQAQMSATPTQGSPSMAYTYEAPVNM